MSDENDELREKQRAERTLFLKIGDILFSIIIAALLLIGVIYWTANRAHMSPWWILFYPGIFLGGWPLFRFWYVPRLYPEGVDPAEVLTRQQRMHMREERDRAHSFTFNGWLFLLTSPFFLVVVPAKGFEEDGWAGAVLGFLFSVLWIAFAIWSIRRGRRKLRKWRNFE